MSKAAVDLKFRAEGRCRLCQRPSYVRKLTRHRVVPGRFHGTYTPNNCVPLCRPCHELVDHWDPSLRLPARRMLRALLWPVEHAYATSHLRFRFVQGVSAFDTMYPRPAREFVAATRAQVG